MAPPQLPSLLLLMLSLLLLQHSAESSVNAASKKYLLFHVDSSMGFGDKQNTYYSLLMLGKLTDRTVVLPPFEIVVPK